MKGECLAGSTALVTGAARRIGRNIATALADSGVNVIIHYRNSGGEAESLRDELISCGAKAWLVRADFDRIEGAQDLFRDAIACAGSIDFLINNASSFFPATVHEISFALLMRDIQVNAWSPFVLSREFARRFGRGKIVNLLDTRVAGYDRSHVGYIISKRVLSDLTEIMSVEFAPGISVNAIAPGLILPPPGKDAQYLEKLAPALPLRRHGEPNDISEAVLYLLKSNFVTGQVIYVDGGRHVMEWNRGPNNNK
jgi:pteridine reductase